VGNELKNRYEKSPIFKVLSAMHNYFNVTVVNDWETLAFKSYVEYNKTNQRMNKKSDLTQRFYGL